ncbi:MAG TPA: Maf family protein [Candidatus Tumulicola sp.]
MDDCPLTRIVLASASPRRLELLRSLGLQVEVEPSGYDEPRLAGLSPWQLAAAHAREKLAAAVGPSGPAAVAVPTVAADTVVDLEGAALGKPADAVDAAWMLRRLSGREHLVHTAFALAVPGREAAIEEASTTRVRFYPLSDAEIAAYVATGEPLDKAGAYGIQGRAAALVEAIEGDFYTVMGFPLARFVRALRGLGFSLPTAKATEFR